MLVAVSFCVFNTKLGQVIFEGAGKSWAVSMTPCHWESSWAHKPLASKSMDDLQVEAVLCWTPRDSFRRTYTISPVCFLVPKKSIICKFNSSLSITKDREKNNLHRKKKKKSEKKHEKKHPSTSFNKNLYSKKSETKRPSHWPGPSWSRRRCSPWPAAPRPRLFWWTFSVKITDKYHQKSSKQIYKNIWKISMVTTVSSSTKQKLTASF